MLFLNQRFLLTQKRKLIIKLIPLLKKIDVFQVKYMKKGQLRDNVIIRYFYKDLTLYFLVSFLFFFMVFFVNNILLTVERLLAQSAPFTDVIRIMWYSLPFVIAQSAPDATLVGFLMSLGGMMSSNEILVIRAAGFSFWKILFPIMTLGLFISIGSFFVNDYLLPLGTVKYNQLFRDIMQSTPTVELESNSAKKMDKASVITGDVSEKSVSDLVLIDSQKDSDRIIIAGKSYFADKLPDGILMSLNMNDSSVISIDKQNRKNFDVITSGKTTLNVFDSTFMGKFDLRAQEMTTYDLGKEIKRMKASESINDKNRLNIWTMEFHKKFSMPFGSLFFALLAFTIAFLFGRKNGQTIGLFVGLIICVIYWAMQISGQLFVQRVGLPAFWCIWVPNFVIGGTGLVFLAILIKK